MAVFGRIRRRPLMGRTYKVKLPDGTERNLAFFSNGRAQLFHDVAHLLEKYVKLPCGISYDSEMDCMWVNAELFVPFFDEFWGYGWLGDSKSSFVYGWAEQAAGIIENMTLTTVTWVDRSHTTLIPQRYASISDEDEALLKKRRDEGKAEVKTNRI